jgi:hypothetical protein
MLLVAAHAAIADGVWPFSSSTNNQTPPAKKTPSMLDKMAAGTKKIFTAPFSKTTTTKPISPTNPWVASTTTTQKKSFLGGLFASKTQPAKPKTVKEFLAQPRVGAP